jgi:hypothetical protein
MHYPGMTESPSPFSIEENHGVDAVDGFFI